MTKYVLDKDGYKVSVDAYPVDNPDISGTDLAITVKRKRGRSLEPEPFFSFVAKTIRSLLLRLGIAV